MSGIYKLKVALITDYGEKWLSRAEEAVSWLDPTEKWRGEGEESSIQEDPDE